MGILLVSALLLAGCGKQLQMTAGLTPLPGDVAAGVIQTEGGGSRHRQVQTSDGERLTELTTSHQSAIRWEQEQDVAAADVAAAEVMFLSTQGTGRLVLRCLDAQGGVVYEGGFVFSGALPTGGQGEWQDRRENANYLGGWRRESVNLDEVLRRNQLAKAVRIQWGVEIGQGQHVLVRGLTLQAQPERRLTAEWTDGLQELGLGQQRDLRLRLTNRSSAGMPAVTLTLEEPVAFGVVCSSSKQVTVGPLAPGATTEVTWSVRGQRGNEVNFGRPWQLQVQSAGRSIAQRELSVQDQRPGIVFYVMTDDLEPMDSAGYGKRWGNGNGWLDPEEFAVQLIAKAEAMNAIAERYGARWTHYTAWPAMEAARWAAERSATGAWPQVMAAVEQSVRNQSAAGHEYGIHLHSDYDPYIAGNVLSYDAETDGVWANHLRHGWAHSLLEEGTYGNRATRLGSLYAYQRILDKLAAESGNGQIVTSRVGSFDFGHGSAEEGKSSRVYRKVGLWGGSDADGNAGGTTAGGFEQAIYFAAADDINSPAKDFAGQGLIQFRPTPQEYIAYDSQPAAIMNRKVDEGMQFYRTSQGAVRAGVHAIVGFTHAMFFLGDGDWKSTQGGTFANLTQHLSFVQQRYAGQGLVFGTASELVKAYLDYYSPVPVAVYGKKTADTWLYEEYAIQVLGKDIPVGPERRHEVRVKYPLYLRETAYRIVVSKNNSPILTTWGVPTDGNEVAFAWDDREAVYTLRVYRNSWLAAANVRLHQLLQFWQRRG